MIGGKDFYPGPHGSMASRIEYDRLIAGQQPFLSEGEREALTVAELFARYWRFAESHYRKGGEATSDLDNVRQALKPLRRLYGHTEARAFDPLGLKAVGQAMIDSGLSRGVVNDRKATFSPPSGVRQSWVIVAPNRMVTRRIAAGTGGMIRLTPGD